MELPMNYFKLLTATLLVLAALPCAAEIYTWTDEKGKTHFSDVPPPKQKKEIIIVEPPPQAGTVITGTGQVKQYKKNDAIRNYNKQASDQRTADKKALNQHKLQQQCDRARSALKDYRDMHNYSNSTIDRGYYEGRIAQLKRRESQACKLSNFR